ncbi:MAG: hypothetical protein KDJ48_14580, partial [Nitratireductor sp.]|nr:hypothetical protein [Nitratireductor sp.]
MRTMPFLSRLAVSGAMLAIMLQPGAALPQAQSTSPAFALGDRNQPADITADRLEVLDGKGLAIFDGNVKVVQGKTSLETVKLTVSYGEGNGGKNSGGAATG